MLFEDSAALRGIVIAAGGIYLTEHHAGPGGGAYWDGVASIVIGVVLAIVQAIESHPNVVKVELLTMHLAPKQILINAHVNLRDDLVTGNIVQTIEEVEELIKRADQRWR